MGLARVKCITDEADFTTRYEALFHASDFWRAQRNLKEMLGSLPSQLKLLVDFDYLSVLLKRESSSEPCWYVLDEQDQSALCLSLEIPAEQLHLSWAFDHQQPVFVPGLQQGAAFLHANRLLNDQGLQSGCAVPITAGHRSLGTLFFGRERYRPWLEDEARFVALIGNRIAVAANDVLSSERRHDNGSDQYLEKESIEPHDEINADSMFEGIVGSSEVLSRVLGNVTRVAPTDASVLIAGESGTGKELIARAIHRRSRRSEGAFVRVNCAAIPPSLIASELFGYEKGAFTGAAQRHLGRFEMANGGTIFLDEIGDIPAETQIALLRVLQERELERVGGTRPVPLNVRVLAATNRDLRAAVAAGTFRQDLYYRLNVFPLEIPPLRQRREDIPLLANYFLARYATQVGKHIRSMERQSLGWLREYEWPGNIRELQNVVERAVILCDGDTLSIDKTWLLSETGNSPSPPFVLSSSLWNQEREIIEAALDASKGRIAGPSGAALKLGMPRTTLESKIKSLRINKHQFKTTLV